MLAKLRLRNFRSFKEDTVIDFTATKYSKLKDTNVSGGVLKGCLFAGDNDSGKSNAINAISILLYLLFDDTDFNMPVNFCFFSADRLMEMEYTFRFGKEEVVYSLAFESSGKVMTEKVTLGASTLLDRTDEGARTTLTAENFYGSSRLQPKSLLLKKLYEETHFAQFPVLAKMFDYLISSVYFNASRNMVASARSYSDKDAVTLTEYIELNGVEGINEFFEKLGFLQRIVYRKPQGGPGRIYVKHRGVEVLVPLSMESLGNKVLLNMLPGYLEVASGGGMLIVDDYGANFHNKQSELLLSWFMKQSANSQLFVATHSTCLMKTSLLRPDQIYTLEFTDGHGTVTHRVSDFQPRELQNLEKMYLEGQFGGLPAYAQMQKKSD